MRPRTKSGIINFALLAKPKQHLRAWRNWQTRTVQVRMGATPWRFKSSRPHHFETNALSGGRFSFLLTHCGRVLQNGNGRIGRFLMMKQCLENGMDIIVVDEALERPYKS